MAKDSIDADVAVRRDKFTGDPRTISVIGYWDHEKKKLVRYTPEEAAAVRQRHRDLLAVKRRQRV